MNIIDGSQRLYDNSTIIFFPTNRMSRIMHIDMKKKEIQPTVSQTNGKSFGWHHLGPKFDSR
jgi:hypothetical protein